MSRLDEALRRTASDLDAMGRKWCLVGGLAVSTRTEPRFTRDVDVAVTVADDRDAERLARDLQALGYGMRAVVEQTATNRLATLRMTVPGDDDSGVILDLLFASSGIEAEVVAGAEPTEILPALRLPVASLGHLIALKVLARDDKHRPQDAVDLRALLLRKTAADLETAEAALDLISQRRYSRGRNLRGELERALQDFG